MKGKPKGKYKVKLSLFIDGIILYLYNPKNYQKSLNSVKHF
jgi:hypothetical protein